MNNKIIGNRGENIAGQYLEEKGYNIIKRNLRNKSGEIDLIVEYEDFIVFVEVKTRRNFNYGFAYEAVGYNKQMKIINTSIEFLMEDEKYLNRKIRYDIVEIYLLKGKLSINHIENAFTT